jgi:hypothetical protein
MNDERTCMICGSATPVEASYCWNCGFTLHSRLESDLESDLASHPVQAAACSQKNQRRRGLLAGLFIIGSLGTIALSFAQCGNCCSCPGCGEEKTKTAPPKKPSSSSCPCNNPCDCPENPCSNDEECDGDFIEGECLEGNTKIPGTNKRARDEDPCYS